MSELADLKDLANLLSEYIIKNEIPITHEKDALLHRFKAYEEEHSVSGLQNLLSLTHREKGHGPSKVLLSCCPDQPHCLYCYAEIAQNDVVDPNNLFCAHGKQIIPLVRMKIVQEFNRVQNLLKRCQVCDKIDDRKFFATYSSHPTCSICTDCILLTYDPAMKQNNCPLCHNQYEEESEIIVRVNKELKMTEEEVKNMYAEVCPRCNVSRDSREFAQICKNLCKVCSECSKALLAENTEKCPINNCGLDITIVNRRG